MKTLKELYEIVKAAGGDFPFSVQNSSGSVSSVLFIGVHTFFIVKHDGLEYAHSKYDHHWKFPAGSPYLGDTERAIKNIESAAQLGKTGLTEAVMDHEIIEANQQRWEDMGRPWGRLKEGALLWMPQNGSTYEFLGMSTKYPGSLKIIKVGFLDDESSFKPSALELSDKTLLSLDDWLLPEQEENWKCKCLGEGRPYEEGDTTCKYCGGDLPELKKIHEPVWLECKFCKGKKDLTWETERYDSTVSSMRPVTHTMPCPYCQPERFKCTD